MSTGRYIAQNVNRTLVYTILILSVLIITFVTIKLGFVFGLAIAFTPLFIIYLISILNNPFVGFVTIFIANYYISGLSRYIREMPEGIVMDIILLVTILSLFLQLFKQDSIYKWGSAVNKLTLIAFIWFGYCILELANPGMSVIGWLTNVRGIGAYFFIIVVITTIIARKFSNFKTILVIWAFLSLTAVLKAVIQMVFGFDAAENYWLFVEGGKTTHIIYSGIRYFSFFTDAANFGTGIAFSGVIFGIASIYIKERGLKILFLITFLASMYGMLISGTRGSIAVPFMAFGYLALLSRNVKIMVTASVFVVSAFLFLYGTELGNSNSSIRRLRSAFDSNDPSLIVRLNNQQKLKTFMADKPFGAGIGMSRGEAKTYSANWFLSTIPSDSWYVLLWMETGVIGLILHVILLLSVLAYGTYLVYFRLKDKELRGLVSALLCGLAGVYVASYSIEIMGQFPTGFIIFICMSFIFLSPVYDNEIQERKSNNVKLNEVNT